MEWSLFLDSEETTHSAEINDTSCEPPSCLSLGEKKIKMADSKKWLLAAPPKFHGLVLGLVGLIDGKGIDVAQPIWSWGCLERTV